MNEVKKERTAAEIQSEYQNLCAKAGHIQYTIDVYQRDLERINATLRDLNNEHSKAKQKEADAAKAVEVNSEVPNETA